MPTTIIPAYPDTVRTIPQNTAFLNIAECFCDTIQGENFVGYPSVFLRMQYCTLSCQWCDTTEVWRKGNPYTIDEVLDLWQDFGVVSKFRTGHHLILTGGSPLRQQKALDTLLREFVHRYNFSPFVEIENECVLYPFELLSWVNRWNNSPKTSNSNMKKELRYKPELLRLMSNLKDSWFKFVIAKEDDWEEIETDFLIPQLIKREQVVLMPEGATQEELSKKREMVVNLAIRQSVRFTDREHIVIWNKKTGV